MTEVLERTFERNLPGEFAAHSETLPPSGGQLGSPPLNAEAAPELSQKAVLLRLSITSWGTDRRLAKHQYEVDASKEMTRAGKKLLVSPELSAIQQLDGSCRDWVASRSLPSRFKQGFYLQPLENLVEVDDYLTAYIARRRELVEWFLAAYPQRVQEARIELRSLFDSANYPSPARLRRRFHVEHEYHELASAPQVLQILSSRLFAREQQKARQRWEEALEEARYVLRSQMSGLVQHLVDRLQPAEDGKPKVFRDSLVQNMEEWLGTFGARNLTDDTELSELVQKARELLHPAPETAITAGQLRSDAGTRSHLQRQFSDIKEQLDRLLTDRPTRRIVLGD